MSFKKESIGELSFFTGSPDCSAAAEALRKHVELAPHPLLGPAETLSNTQLGNLGEALAYLAVTATDFTHSTHKLFADNVANPLAVSSRVGLDLFWVTFHPEDPALDHAWIQEVKTTLSVPDIQYITSVVGDYQKLFFQQQVDLTLESRLYAAAWKLQVEQGRSDLAKRVRGLGARSPGAATRVTLLPTGIHDRAADGFATLEAIRIQLIEMGWGEANVKPMSVALSELADRLRRVASQ